MKRLQFPVALLLLLGAFAFHACSEAELIEEDAAPLAAEATDTDVIAQLGLDPSTILEFDDHYLVEGDIRLYKTSFDFYRELNSETPQTRQARNKSICKKQYTNNIKVYLGSDLPTIWKTGIRKAMSAYSEIDGLAVNMSVTTGSDYDIFISTATLANPDAIAQSSFPSNYRPGPTVHISKPDLDMYTEDEITAIMVHELGHNIGMYHTDWKFLPGHNNGVHITGTPKTDSLSIYNGWFDGRGWIERGGFTVHDRYALWTLYAESSGGYRPPTTDEQDKEKIVEDESIDESVDSDEAPLYTILYNHPVNDNFINPSPFLINPGQEIFTRPYEEIEFFWEGPIPIFVGQPWGIGLTNAAADVKVSYVDGQMIRFMFTGKEEMMFEGIRTFYLYYYSDQGDYRCTITCDAELSMVEIQ